MLLQHVPDQRRAILVECDESLNPKPYKPYKHILPQETRHLVVKP